MPKYLFRQIATGAALGSLFIVLGLWQAGPGANALMREAARQPWQLPALWLSAVAPFALAFLGGALCCDAAPGSDGRRPVKIRGRH